MVTFYVRFILYIDYRVMVLFPESRRWSTEVTLHETVEISWRGEVEHISNLCKSHVALLKQSSDIDSGKAQNPVIG